MSAPATEEEERLRALLREGAKLVEGLIKLLDAAAIELDGYTATRIDRFVLEATK